MPLLATGNCVLKLCQSAIADVCISLVWHWFWYKHTLLDCAIVCDYYALLWLFTLDMERVFLIAIYVNRLIHTQCLLITLFTHTNTTDINNSSKPFLSMTIYLAHFHMCFHDDVHIIISYSIRHISDWNVCPFWMWESTEHWSLRWPWQIGWKQEI